MKEPDKYESKDNQNFDASQGIYDYTKSFSEQLNDWVQGEIPQYDSLLVDEMPEVFRKIGFNALPFIEVDGYGKQNDIVIDSNAVVSVFAKNNAVTKQLSSAIENELKGNVSVFYLNNNKTAALLQKAGLQLPGVLVRNNGYIHSIRDNGSNVKPRFENVTESSQFKRWFGDWQNDPKHASKVVNEDGTPKVVYHQTKYTFDTFNTDNQQAGKNDSQTPTGIFFKTTADDIGLDGNIQMQVYLNARNILEFNNRSEIQRYWEKNVQGYSELQRQYDEIERKYKQEYSREEAAGDKWYDLHYDDLVSGKITNEEADRIMTEPLNKVLSEWEAKTESIAREQKKLITEYINNSQYDCIHLANDESASGKPVDTYIVFKRNQIKSVDNIGTYDESQNNIYYSPKDSDKYERAAREIYEKLKSGEEIDFSDETK